MAVRKIRWYVKAQAGVLLLPAGLCLFGEAVQRRTLQSMGGGQGPWFWYGTLSLVAIVAGVGLMVESGLLRGYPGQQQRNE
jgi:hypothetical protein